MSVVTVFGIAGGAGAHLEGSAEGLDFASDGGFGGSQGSAGACALVEEGRGADGREERGEDCETHFRGCSGVLWAKSLE